MLYHISEQMTQFTLYHVMYISTDSELLKLLRKQSDDDVAIRISLYDEILDYSIFANSVILTNIKS